MDAVVGVCFRDGFLLRRYGLLVSDVVSKVC